jgi:predicted Fe-S protein YdhL (DUF1289 family)
MDELDALAPSPCVKVCALDATKSWCTGCHRTLDEIAGWRTMTLAERQAVLRRVAARCEAWAIVASDARAVPPDTTAGSPHGR